MGRLEKQQALLLESQEGHYEDVEELEGMVEQGTNILDNLEADSHKARTTTENVLAVAKAARDIVLVLLGLGGLGLLLWTLSQKAKSMQRQRQRPPRPRQRHRQRQHQRTLPQQSSHRQLQRQRKHQQRMVFERWTRVSLWALEWRPLGHPLWW